MLGADFRQPEAAEGEGEDAADALGGVAPAPGVRAQDVADGGDGAVAVELDDADEVAVHRQAEHVQHARDLGCGVAHVAVGFGGVHGLAAQMPCRFRAVDPQQGLGVARAQLDQLSTVSRSLASSAAVGRSSGSARRTGRRWFWIAGHGNAWDSGTALAAMASRCLPSGVSRLSPAAE